MEETRHHSSPAQYHPNVGVFSSGRGWGTGQNWGKTEWSKVQDENLVQSAQDIRMGWRFTFQQDLKHTAKTTQEWLRNNSVSVLEWPSQRHGLNPIKHLWMPWKWLSTDGLHPSWQSLRGCAEKNERTSPNPGVQSFPKKTWGCNHYQRFFN